ncbi:GGDEF domain-containing protein [Chelativorans sp. Marseille-P2723]|uniref:GGDEF domain-containing protein n=1 Tax=Chelativorans sp. Marseille-P2723 TaxID=2709133 RepID=UPI00156E9A47|nr:GGDEF domain-containing protein [Chelativorans sp. Marseille-P2723]
MALERVALLDGKLSNWIRRFLKLPLFVQCTVIVAIAVLATASLTLAFYYVFFRDRLALDLVLSMVIAVLVGYPLSRVFLKQTAQLIKMTDELERISRIDDLTQLLNRRSFFAATHSEIAGAQGEESAGALLFIDVDYFKALNDTMGHSAGDAVLERFGTALSACLQEGQIAGRLGGEEFAVFLPYMGKEEAGQLCKKIREEISLIPKELGLEDWRLTVSIGVAVQRTGQNLEELLRSADLSLYKAKFQGRDRTVYFQDADLAA